MACSIHPTAIVEAGAELGLDVTIGAYTLIGRNVKIGDRCNIGPHVVIERYTTLGPETNVSQFASIGAPPQDLKFKDEPSELIIGAKNIIREFTTIQPGTEHGTMKTTIGDSNLFMANSHVAHDCRVGSNNVFANSVALAGHVTIGDRVILGGLSAIHQFVRVGDFAMISGGSMVGLDIPPYCIAQGDRAQLRGINLIGLKRAGLSGDEISEIKRCYRYFFSSVGKLEEKLQAFPAERATTPAVQKFVAFLGESERGVSLPAKSL